MAGKNAFDLVPASAATPIEKHVRHTRERTISGRLLVAALLAGIAPGARIDAARLTQHVPATRTRKTPHATRPCLACGAPKQHNNSFCSAECCRAWKEGRRSR